ncbi:restriction endonuclease [Chloroflexota bacterium]
MSLWMVRAGAHGEQEQGAIDNDVITIGWNELANLSQFDTRNDLKKAFMKAHPSAKKNAMANEVGQVWRFANEIKKGDLVALPLKRQSAIAIGRVTGDYEYKKIDENILHIRSVDWLKTIPRSAFEQGILYSFGAFMTVCRITRYDAENKVKKLIQLEDYSVEEEDIEISTPETIDVEQAARDRVVKYIGAKYKGHGLSRIIDAILKAQGYITRSSSPGPDGGVDILAAAGPLGLDKPWLCVQVKSSSGQTDVKILRELQGVMARVKADQGLLISWGGFSKECIKEASDAFFSVKLWDQGALIEQIFKYYNEFDSELKAELPLKQIWMLVPEE